MLYVSHSTRHRKTCDASANEATKTEQPMKRRHDRTLVASLNFNGLRVHGDIEHAITRAEERKRECKYTDIVTDNRQRKGQAESERSHRCHAAAAEPTDQPSFRGNANTEPTAIESNTRPSCPSPI